MALIILDVETYLYKACSACKILKQLNNSPYVFTECYDLRKGFDFINSTVERLQNTLLCNDVVMVIGDKNNFRKQINPCYKSNREGKPLIYPNILEYINQNFDVVSLKNLEADDTARIIYEDNQNYPCRKIIVSVDKDFYSVPCEFFRDLNGNNSIEIVKEVDARKHLLKQIIMGDKTDGYNGIKGCGEKFCDEFITDETTFADVLQLYQDKGLSPREYTINKAMANIVSLNQYDFNTGKVNLEKD